MRIPTFPVLKRLVIDPIRSKVPESLALQHLLAAN